MPRLDPIRAGYLPLLDSAVLLVAARMGHAESCGIDLVLSRETSWATIRDRMGVGQFDVAHMLAPMPIAATLGLSPLAVPMLAPFVLALGGNAVTVSNAVADAMDATDASPQGPAAAGRALFHAIEAGRRKGDLRMRFAVVHRHSSHNYDLRYWLSASGIKPDRDVEITVVPPPLMPDALANGQIDGFCVGEPWNTIAVRRAAGRIVTTKAEIWRRGPEKVLAVAAGFAAAEGDVLARLLRALEAAARWCDEAANREALAGFLAAPEHIGVSAQAMLPALLGKLEIQAGRHREVEDFIVYHAGGANRPDPLHARWLFRQMSRWGDTGWSKTVADRAEAVFRPDIYERALGLMHQPPAIDFSGPAGDPADPPPGLYDQPVPLKP